MAMIAISHLYRLRDDLPHEERVMAAVIGLESGKLYWLHGSRPSSIGGYIGQLSGTYEHALGISPSHVRFSNVPMRYVVNVPFGDYLSTE